MRCLQCCLHKASTDTIPRQDVVAVHVAPALWDCIFWACMPCRHLLTPHQQVQSKQLFQHGATESWWQDSIQAVLKTENTEPTVSANTLCRASPEPCFNGPIFKGTIACGGATNVSTTASIGKRFCENKAPGQRQSLSQAD